MTSFIYRGNHELKCNIGLADTVKVYVNPGYIFGRIDGKPAIKWNSQISHS